MQRIIRIRDLDRYQKLTQEEKEKNRSFANRGFDLSRLPTDCLAREVSEYILDIGKRRLPSSMKTLLWPYNQMSRFLCEKHPDLQTLKNTDLAPLIREYKKWLLCNGKNPMVIRVKATGYTSHEEAEGMVLLRRIWRFVNQKPEFSREQDRWILEQLPFPVIQNPVKPSISISFSKIRGTRIRQEVKDIIYQELPNTPIGTIRTHLTAINRFCSFLDERYPRTQSLTELDRDILKTYFRYLNIEADSRKSYRSDEYALKSVLFLGGIIFDHAELRDLFFESDFSPKLDHMPRVYSDAELRRLNAVFIRQEPQLARVFLVHELLGTRISETLTLRTDCLYSDEQGHCRIRIQQQKSGREYTKPVDEKVAVLVEKSITWTTEKYGPSEYVFARSQSEPMRYGMIHERLLVMIHKNDLRDDRGELFPAKTHVFRAIYGTKLAESGARDEVIAALLGHRGIGSVQAYRKLSGEKLQDATKTTRDKRNAELKQLQEEIRYGEKCGCDDPDQKKGERGKNGGCAGSHR